MITPTPRPPAPHPRPLIDTLFNMLPLIIRIDYKN